MDPRKADEETRKRIRDGGATEENQGYDIGQDEEAGSSATRGVDRPGKLDESGAVLEDDDDK